MPRRTRAEVAAASTAQTTSSTSLVSESNAAESRGEANGTAHASQKSRDDTSRTENIFLFWPNLIGYVRVVLAFASLYYMPLHPRTCSFLYSVSCLLDALDGYAARIFEQSTKFGAVLDMVTDRCTTSCLLVFLSSAFPRWAILFQGLIALDFASHYIHMYATLVAGGADSSHKTIRMDQNVLLRIYYTNKTVLFTLCAMNELFFIALYLLSFSSPILSPHLIKSVTDTSGTFQPGTQVNSSILRQIFADPFSPSALELARVNKMDSTIPWTLASISFLFMLAKQILNVLQLIMASQILADEDVKSRKAKGLPRARKAKRV